MTADCQEPETDFLLSFLSCFSFLPSFLRLYLSLSIYNLLKPPSCVELGYHCAQLKKSKPREAEKCAQDHIDTTVAKLVLKFRSR